MQSMVEMLNIPQIYGTKYHDHQIHHEYHLRNSKSINNKILDEKKIINASYYNNNDNNNNNKTTKNQSLISALNNKGTTTSTSTAKTHDSQHIKGGGGGGAVLTDIYASLSSLQSIKSPTHYIEKFINSDLFKNYERLKLSNKYLSSHGTVSAKSITDKVFFKKVPQQQQQQQQQQYQSQEQKKQSNISVNKEDNTYSELNCLQSRYRHKNSIDTDVGIYESVRFNVPNQLKPTTILKAEEEEEEDEINTNTIKMINKCSHNFLAENINSPPVAANFQKLSECDQDLPKDTASSGPSSSTSDINSDNPIYRHLQMPTTSPNKRNPIERITKNGSVRIYVDACPIYSQTPQNANESASENSSSSIAATTTTTYSSSTVQRTSSASSSGEYQGSYHAMNYGSYDNTAVPKVNSYVSDTSGNTQPERLQRRKLLQMIASLDQQNKALQRELIRERRRRSEELSRVVKSLLCFESKLKLDMKSANQRMQEKDLEICRLTRQNRALKKGFMKLHKNRQTTQDEGVIVTDDNTQAELVDKLGMDFCQAQEVENNLLEDCLVLEALQCINCRKQFYDIGNKEGWTQTNNLTEGCRNIDEHTTEHGSSSDDTVSSSFYGARRSVRYTSKRTAGTFRDYMRSRAMNVDDTLLADCLNWDNMSTLSRDSHSSTSNEKLNYCTQNEKKQDKSKIDAAEEDDGIFSPTQDDEFEDDMETNNNNNKTLIMSAINKHVKSTAPEFSEASPKQIYETSTDDWYASASDQDDLAEGCNTKCYTLAAVNPVLECVNQILLQQTMEETPTENGIDIKETKTTVAVQSNLPRRSSLSGRRQGRNNSTNEDAAQKGSVRNKTMTRKRVHFSTKNSMVHLPRHESDNEQELEKTQLEIPQKQTEKCYGTSYFSTTPAKATMIKINANLPTSPPTGMPLIIQDGPERLDTLNYESIYSNEYEPIGSEQNSSNLYVEMETERLKSPQKTKRTSSTDGIKVCKTPPALPPKPANLLKFKKTLLQLTEIIGDSNNVIPEPDYCSISEVNVGMTSVQIVVDVHNAPESVLSSNDLETNKNFPELTFAAEEVATINSDETCAASQKTEEVEEIFADIPKLPNVAAIIVPKQAKYQQELKQTPQKQQNIILHQNNAKTMLNEYLSMTPKFQTVQKLLINSTETPENLRLGNTHKVVITNGDKNNSIHINNIYKNHNNNNNSINNNNNSSLIKINSASNLLKDLETVTIAGTLPLQEEFDWYNLDAEYGKAKVSVNDHKVQSSSLLEEINEDHESERECAATTADEYKLDEEFCLATETVEEIEIKINNKNNNNNEEDNLHRELNAVIRENIESRNKAKKLHKNLDTFEKFIEGSGLSTKPLPHKRKIYFAGPFV